MRVSVHLQVKPLELMPITSLGLTLSENKFWWPEGGRDSEQVWTLWKDG